MSTRLRRGVAALGNYPIIFTVLFIILVERTKTTATVVRNQPPPVQQVSQLFLAGVAMLRLEAILLPLPITEWVNWGRGGGEVAEREQVSVLPKFNSYFYNLFFTRNLAILKQTVKYKHFSSENIFVGYRSILSFEVTLSRRGHCVQWSTWVLCVQWLRFPACHSRRSGKGKVFDLVWWKDI